MRDKLYRFMQGRNGMDELARMQSWLVLILLLVGMFTRIGLFSFVALILMIYMYFRVMSLGDHLSSTIVANRLKRPT